MVNFTPTEEQGAIVAFANVCEANMLISAYAGAAKTSTLELIAERIRPKEPTLCLAFNKKIKEEMKQRLPSHFECSTLNALGHHAWKATISGRVKVEGRKNYTILDDYKKTLGRREQDAFTEVFMDYVKALSVAKTIGYIPEKIVQERGVDRGLYINPLSTREDLAEALETSTDLSCDPATLALIDNLLEKSITQAYAGLIDFDDQIYMSTLFGGMFPRFPLVMVDEAQDLSPLNHAMLQKLVVKRLIAVGDRNQSIYAFRGADTFSMDKLKEEFNMEELFLTISFRCPKKVIERANELRGVDMQPSPNAIEGYVGPLTETREWSLSDIPDSAAIICRNNAPLFNIALKLIKARRGINFLGKDLEKTLTKILKKIGTKTMNAERLLQAINKWEDERLSKVSESRQANISDRAECLRIFVAEGGSLEGALNYAKLLFEQEGSIQIMTGHKSKGLEYDEVIHLDPHRIPSKYAQIALDLGHEAPMEQESNLRYVIETRAKKALYFADLDNLIS